jgi:hypothetical protein
MPTTTVSGFVEEIAMESAGFPSRETPEFVTVQLPAAFVERYRYAEPK